MLLNFCMYASQCKGMGKLLCSCMGATKSMLYVLVVDSQQLQKAYEELLEGPDDNSGANRGRALQSEEGCLHTM